MRWGNPLDFSSPMKANAGEKEARRGGVKQWKPSEGRERLGVEELETRFVSVPPSPSSHLLPVYESTPAKLSLRSHLKSSFEIVRCRWYNVCYEYWQWLLFEGWVYDSRHFVRHVYERRETLRLFLEPSFRMTFIPCPNVRPFPNETRQQREFKGDCSEANDLTMVAFLDLSENRTFCCTRGCFTECFSPKRVFFFFFLKKKLELLNSKD